MERRESGLYVFSKNHYARERIVELPNGKKAVVRTDDSGTVDQIEEDDRLHAVVRPKTQVIKIRRQQ